MSGNAKPHHHQQCVPFKIAGTPPHPLVSLSSLADADANIAHGVAGHAEWLDAEKTKIVIMLKSPSEWADAIYAWVDKSGQQGTVCTIHELMNGFVIPCTVPSTFFPTSAAAGLGTLSMGSFFCCIRASSRTPLQRCGF
jgi:hypothetical protein